MKHLLINILCFLATSVIRKYKPDIVAITGSVGKTTAKEAIVRVLSETHNVRGSEKSYNNELGVPLTIIGMHTPARSLVSWIRIFLRTLLLLLKKDRRYPSILILEMGADAPGDIEYLVSIAPPKIAVITAIGPTHLEKLRNLEQLIEEKKKIFSRHTRSDQWIVLNIDDPYLSLWRKPEYSESNIFTFGRKESADLRVSDVTERYLFYPNQTEHIAGVFSTLTYRGESVRAEFPRLLGSHILPSVIAAAAIGCIYDIPLPEITRRLHEAQPAPGRMHAIPGIKNTFIIDDTYNSSPLAARGAIDVLMSFEISGDARRIAVLGDMRELGAHTEREHHALGIYAAQHGIDYVFAVGDAAAYLVSGVKEILDETHIFVFNDSISAGHALQDFMKRGDVILVKGSQAVRMEKIIKEVMAEPHRAADLLVRQDPEWL